MRWVIYESGDGERLGLLVDGEIRGLEAGLDLVALLDAGDGALEEQADRARRSPLEVRALDAVRLRPPLRPRSIRDFLSFLDHLRQCRGGRELNDTWYEIPGFYFSNHQAVVGPHDDVAVYPGSERFDFELEVAAVIGRRGCDLDPADASAHIAGYTILCDWSARDLQHREASLGLGPTKGKDGANTLGPAFVSADELASFVSGPSFHLRMQAWVNDDQLTDGWLDRMDWSFAEIVAYASQGTVLVPGDVIGSGTVPNGCLLEHFATRGDDFPGWLQPGDVVRLEVEQLGVVRQRVVAGGPVRPLPVRPRPQPSST